MTDQGQSLKRFLKIALHSISASAALFCGPALPDQMDSQRAHLVQAGLTPSVIFDGTVVADTAGGTRTGTAFVGNLRLQLALDGGRLFRAPGWTAFFQALSVHGDQPSHFIGDTQGVNSYAAQSTLRLYEAWGQYSLPSGRWSFLAGRYDASSEFYRLASTGLFLNSSFGTGPEFSQSGIGGPSIFSDTSVGARLLFKPSPNILIRTALMDGAPVNRADGQTRFFGQQKGVLIVSEIDLLTRPEADDSSGVARYRVGRGANFPAYDDKIAFGAWHYTGTFQDLSLTGSMARPLQHEGSSGAYVLVDRTVWKPAENPAARLSAFLQYGVGDRRVEQVGSYASAGLTALGFLSSRPDDELGLAVASARNGSHYIDSQNTMRLPVTRAETSIEATYFMPLNSKFSVQPDIQYVIHPGTSPARANATVLQVHFQMTL